MTLQLDAGLKVLARARDGREAINLASFLQPDVVLMGLQMPVLNLIEATREVRRVAPGCRVVIVTASASADDESRAREAGASAYVRKGGLAAELFARSSTRLANRLEPEKHSYEKCRQSRRQHHGREGSRR